MEEKQFDSVMTNRPSQDAWRLVYRLIVANILPRIAAQEQEPSTAQSPDRALEKTP